jgi:hypothetical protein
LADDLNDSRGSPFRSVGTDKLIELMKQPDFDLSASLHKAIAGKSFVASPVDLAANRAKNLPIGQLPAAELAADITIDEDMLREVAKSQKFEVFYCINDFYGYEERHLPSLSNGQLFIALQTWKEVDWVLGCADTAPNEFGFVPKTCLQFNHEFNRA